MNHLQTKVRQIILMQQITVLQCQVTLSKENSSVYITSTDFIFQLLKYFSVSSILSILALNVLDAQKSMQ